MIIITQGKVNRDQNYLKIYKKGGLYPPFLVINFAEFLDKPVAKLRRHC